MSSGKSRKSLSKTKKTNQKSSWQRNDGLIKYKSCLLYKKQDRGSTLKTEQSFAKVCGCKNPNKERSQFASNKFWDKDFKEIEWAIIQT